MGTRVASKISWKLPVSTFSKERIPSSLYMERHVQMLPTRLESGVTPRCLYRVHATDVLLRKLSA